MTVFEGFESLSGSPLIPTDLAWVTGSFDAGLSSSGSGSNVTQGSQSYRINGTTVAGGPGDPCFSMQFSNSGEEIPEGTTTLFLDVTISDECAIAMSFGPGEGNVQSNVIESPGSGTLEMDISPIAGNFSISTLSVFIFQDDVGASVDVYMDNLRDDTGGATGNPWNYYAQIQ